jgi:hypothetical protein
LEVEPQHLAFSEAAKRVLPRLDFFAALLIEQIRAYRPRLPGRPNRDFLSLFLLQGQRQILR